MMPTVTFSFSKASRRRLAIGIFIVSWWIGTASLFAGLKGLGEFWPICTFAAACALWFWGFTVSDLENGTRNPGGYVVIALWMIHLMVAALFSSHHSITDLVFLICLAETLSFVVAIAPSAPRTDQGAVGE
jgi:hypothetical protein